MSVRESVEPIVVLGIKLPVPLTAGMAAAISKRGYRGYERAEGPPSQA